MTDIFDNSQMMTLLKLLERASLFELYRLRVVLDGKLENPDRIYAARQLFKEGDTIEYFQADMNVFVLAVVKKKHPKQVSVVNCHNQQVWRIPYYMIKLDHRDIVLERYQSKEKGLTKDSISVGDLVGLNHDGQQIVGRVERLNHKTVSVITSDQRRWRVSYKLLHAIIESTVVEETQNIKCLPQDWEK